MKKCMCGVELPDQHPHDQCYVCRSAGRRKIISRKEIEELGVPRVIAKNLIASELIIPFKEDIPLHLQGFYLFGKAGRGKSHQAALLMQVVATALPFNSCAWANVPQLLFDIRQSFGKSIGTPGKESTEGATLEEVILFRCSNIHWLCLDDLGSEKFSDWANQTLYLIINKRYENELTTVITSNASLDEIAEKFGDDRLPSRIAGMCTPIEIEGRDRRNE